MDMKTTPYYKIFADVYTLLAQFMPVRTDKTYWDALVYESDKLYRNYNQSNEPGHMYARKLILETVDELGRVSTEMEAAEKAGPAPWED